MRSILPLSEYRSIVASLPKAAEFTTSRRRFRPTLAPPGSEEKIAEMERRAAAGQPCFHPQDLDTATIDRLIHLGVVGEPTGGRVGERGTGESTFDVKPKAVIRLAGAGAA